MKEVIIIGGGIVGVCTAWYLHQEGMDVTVIDEGDFTSGCTFGNAGMIVPSHFVPLASPGMIAKGLRWMFDRNSPFYIRPRPDAALLRWLWLFYKSANKNHVATCAPVLREMHEEGRTAFREWQEHPSFDFDYVQDGILMLYNSKRGEADELAAAEYAASLGIATRHLTGNALSTVEPALKEAGVGGVYYPGDATLSPDIFMQQMIGWLKQAGVLFLPAMKAVQLIEEERGRCVVKCDNGTMLYSKQVIVSNGVWSSQLLSSKGSKLPMQDGKGYSMTIQRHANHPRVPAILHEARVAVTPLQNRIRISGTLEISGMDDTIRPAKVEGILASLPAYYRDIEIESPSDVWYGYRPCTPDGMPYIGWLPKSSSIIVASGHAMMGLSLAPATGRMVRDLIVRQAPPPAVLRPGRF